MVPDFFPGKSVPFTRKQSALASSSLDESETRAVYKKATFPEVMLCCAARTLFGRQAPRRTSLFSFFFLPRRKTDRTSISFIRVSFESRTLNPRTRAMRINHMIALLFLADFFTKDDSIRSLRCGLRCDDGDMVSGSIYKVKRPKNCEKTSENTQKWKK